MHHVVVFAPEADDQLAELLLYVAEQASADVAERYVTAVVATCESLAVFPHRGVARDDIRPGLRVTHHKGRTIIAYAVNDMLARVVILGVFYGGQDYAGALQADSEK
jgi:toxin ParE1/3/4